MLWRFQVFLHNIQGGAEPTDTFHMVIDNIWKQRKISKTVYKYVQVRYLLPTNYKLIFLTPGRWPLFTSMHCCKRVWKLPYTRLRRSSSIAATSSTMACLSSWIVTIRLRNTRSFRNPHRKKSGTVRSGDRAGQAVSPNYEHRFRRSIATDHIEMVSSSLPFPFPPTMTSYRAGAIFKCEMCRSVSRHTVYCRISKIMKLLFGSRLHSLDSYILSLF